MTQDQKVDAGVALRLGHFVGDVQWQDVPDALQHDAKRALLNFFGCALGAAGHAG